MDAVREQLHWLKRNSKIPTSPDDRCVARLLYGEQDTEMGLVCETADGMYWSFTTNPNIVCMSPDAYLIKYDQPEKACDALRDYVLSEVHRLIKVNSVMPYIVTREFKKRDRIAFEEYVKEALMKAIFRGKEAFAATFKRGFKAGADWILRSEGWPRRPYWAHYLVMNRSGDYTWFEHKPTLDHNFGVWVSPEGRAKKVRHADWQTSITRLD